MKPPPPVIRILMGTPALATLHREPGRALDGIEQPRRAAPVAEPEKFCHVRLARVASQREVCKTLPRQRLDRFTDRHRPCDAPELERAAFLAREHPRLPRHGDPQVRKLWAD